MTLEPAPRPWCVDEDGRPTDEPEWVVSWSALPIQAHLYTRLPNSLRDAARSIDREASSRDRELANAPRRCRSRVRAVSGGGLAGCRRQTRGFSRRPDGAAAFLCSARDCCGAKTLENDGAGPTAALDVNKELVTECAFCLAPRRAAPRHKGGTK